MAWGFRKSFRAGPIRVNLSKSGLGASVGVKGARLGVGSRGRAYVSGGAGGLYYRDTLGSSTRSASARSSPSLGLVDFVDTGVAYPSKFERPRLPADAGPSMPEKMKGLLPFSVVSFFVWLWESPVGYVFFAIVGVGIIHNMLFDRKKARFEREVLAFADALDAGEDLDKFVTKTFLNSFSGAFKAAFLQRLYPALLMSAANRIAEGKAVDTARYNGMSLAKTLGIPKRKARAFSVHAFRLMLQASLSDQFLDQTEESALRKYIELAEIEPSNVTSEIALIDEMSNVRERLANGLQPIDVDIKLQRDEVCYYESEARFLKEKQLRKQQIAGSTYKQVGYDIDKEGTLYLTSKRILLVHDGTSSISLEKVLSIDAFPEGNYVKLVQDGRDKPFIVTVPNVLLFSGILNELWKSAA